MYAKWCSCTGELLNSLTSPSILDKFPQNSAREIVSITLRHLLDFSKPHQEDRVPTAELSLSNEREVDWVLEVICYSLTMNYGDNVSEVALLLTRWIEGISPVKPDNIPPLIVRDIVHYFPILLSMLLNLMHNRRDKEGKLSTPHIKLCFTVLSKISTALENSKILTSAEWEAALKFYIKATEIRLSYDWHPQAGTANKQLLSHVFTVWFLSSINFFPSPRMWKTLTEFLQLWQDRSATVEIWISMVLESTYQVLTRLSMLPPNYSPVRGDEIIGVRRLFCAFPSPLMAKSWFHLLHILGNPVKLASPDTLECYMLSMSKSNYDSSVFLKTAVCITRNFKMAMNGLSQTVDLFLDSTLFCNNSNQKFPVFYCDNILNLFGTWLFEAASYATDSRSSGISSNFRETLGEQAISVIQELSQPIISGCSIACGTLCRLICSIDESESILPVYLVRFYFVLLRIMGEDVEVQESSLVHMLSNSGNLFVINLPATNIIIFRFLISIRDFLTKYDNIYINYDSGDFAALKGTLSILESIVSVPTYYQEMKLTSLLSTCKKTEHSWINISSIIVDILVNALTMKLEIDNLSKILNMIIITVTELSLSEVNYKKHFVVHNKGVTVDRIDFFSQKLTTCITDSWRNANSRILIGIEALAELGRVRFNTCHSNERRKTIMWICGFIKIRYNMSSDGGWLEMSGILMATYNCLLAWLTTSFDILADSYCVRLMLEAVEFISNSQISIDRKSTRIGDKQTISQRSNKKDAGSAVDPRKTRLKQIGELIVHLIMSHPTGDQCPHCLVLDESSAVRVLSLEESAQGNIKYFAFDNYHILSLFEQSEGQTTYCILRTPFARKFFKIEIPSPKLMPVSPFPHDSKNDRFPLLKDFPKPKCIHPTCEDNLECELSVPSVVEVELKANCVNMANLVNLQIAKERQIAANTFLHIGPKKMDDNCSVTSDSSSEMRNVNHLYATRVILSYLGLINQDNIKDKKSFNSVFCYLDSSGSDFFRELKMLDLLPTKLHNTAFVCYVSEGQSKADSIISNYTIPMANLPSNFMNFFMSLGSPIKLKDYSDSPGFIGCFYHFSKQTKCETSPELLGDFGGTSQLLYWADVLNELAFVVPSLISRESKLSSVRSPSPPIKSPYQIEDDADYMSFEYTPRNIGRYFANFVPLLHEIPSLIGAQMDPVVIVAWFQNIKDVANFPISDLGTKICARYDTRGKQQRDFVGILLVPLKSGLVRVYIRTYSHRTVSLGNASPLNDGMVINPLTLGSLVRKTVLEINRHRLRLIREKDRLPHVLRSSQIERFVKNWRLPMEESTFYTALFQTK